MRLTRYEVAIDRCKKLPDGIEVWTKTVHSPKRDAINAIINVARKDDKLTNSELVKLITYAKDD